MLAAVLGWLPIIGPIIQGLTGVVNKWQDNKLDALKTTRASDIEEAKVSAQIIHDTNDSIGLRVMRDMLCFPIVVWCTLGAWDTIMAIRYPWLMFHVEKFPESMAYYPYAVLVFLLGNIGINMFNRK